jgi:hypothetical protein
MFTIEHTLDAIRTPSSRRCLGEFRSCPAKLKALHPHIVSYREQMFAANPYQYFGMMKNSKESIVPARTTIASVHKEMQKPRLTESVRNHGRGQAAPAMKQPSARPVRVCVSDRRPSV